MEVNIVFQNSVKWVFIIIIYPLTARVAEAPHMISKPVFSIFPYFPPLGKLQACPFPDVVFPPLPVSALSSSPFHCALQDGFSQTWWTGVMTISLQLASLYNGQEVFVWSNCLLNLGIDFLVANMVVVWVALYLVVAPHSHGLYSSFELCCEGPWLTSIQEDGCDKGAQQLLRKIFPSFQTGDVWHTGSFS